MKAKRFNGSSRSTDEACSQTIEPTLASYDHHKKTSAPHTTVGTTWASSHRSTALETSRATLHVQCMQPKHQNRAGGIVTGHSQRQDPRSCQRYPPTNSRDAGPGKHIQCRRCASIPMTAASQQQATHRTTKGRTANDDGRYGQSRAVHSFTSCHPEQARVGNCGKQNGNSQRLHIMPLSC